MTNLSGAPSPFTIKEICVKDLPDLARESAKRTGVQPISLQRALAHSHNPNADPDEIGLLAAYQGDDCIGYIGILPSVFRLNGQNFKIHWFSTWYAKPEMRNTGVGMALLMHAFSLNKDYFITGISDDAQKVYDRLGLPQIAPLEYTLLNTGDALNLPSLPLRFLRRVLREKGKSLRRINAAIDAVHLMLSPVKRLIYGIAGSRVKSRLKEISYRETGRPEKWEGVEPAQDRGCFYREKKCIEWMLAHPWLVEDPDETPDSRYFFSSTSKTHRYIVLEVRSKDRSEHKGSVILSFLQRSGTRTVKLLDYSFPRQEDRIYALALALEYATRLAADQLFVAQEFGGHIHAPGALKRLVHTEKRKYVYRLRKDSELAAQSVQSALLQYPDGDSAFT